MTHRITLVVTLVFCLCVALTAAPMAFGQAAAPNPDVAKKVEALAKQLSLTADQKEKLLPVLADEAPKLKAVKADTTLTGLQKLQKIRAIHAETDPKVKAILTPTQYEQWQTIRQQEIHDMIEKKKAE
jgi:Spy/CpxP family protein refolding chaperone